MRFVNINISAILDASFFTACLIIVFFSLRLTFSRSVFLILQTKAYRLTIFDPHIKYSIRSISMGEKLALFIICLLFEKRIRSVYQRENHPPASGDNTIIIIENVKDSMEINVARWSDGNIS